MSDIESKRRAVGRENPEPEEGRNPWPYAVWLFFGVMIGWGVTYLSLQAGSGGVDGGDRRAIISSPSESAPQPPVVDARLAGQKVYQNVCMACHQQTGLGVPGAFPPLAGSEWALGDAQIPVKIILKGLQGAITVKGAHFSGVMPPFEEQFSDEEIAAVVTYVRSEWGNAAAPIGTAEVHEIREKFKSRAAPWMAKELKD